MTAHPTHEEDFELYALGVLEGEERSAIESHAASCAECTQKLAAAQGRIALLALAAPRMEPSAAVKDRLMRQLHEASAAGSSATVPAAAPARLPRRGPDVLAPSGVAFGRWWTAVLVPATLALALVSAFLWKQNDRLQNEIDRQHKETQTLHKQLDYQRRVADVMEGPNTINVALRPMPGMGKGGAKVFYNAAKGKLVYDGWIEPAPSDKSYQLWVVPMDGSPISVGVFNPVTEDSASWIASVPQGVQAKAFAITLEPAGGEDQPTGPQVLASNGT